jgi:hypothetical protein
VKVEEDEFSFEGLLVCGMAICAISSGKFGNGMIFLLQAINGAAGERSTLFVEYYKKTFDKRNADDDSLKNQRDHLAVRK